MIVTGARYEGNTQNTSDYDMTMDLNVSNIDKNDKNIQRTIYKANDEGYFVRVKLLIIEFINLC